MRYENFKENIVLKGRIEIETNTGTIVVGIFKEQRNKNSQKFIVVEANGEEILVNEKVIGVIQPCGWGQDGVRRKR